jgi:hypothetical protein
MSFLAPLFLLGALAIAGPVIFHLIRRTTREITPFSSLMFLKPTPPRVTRKSRLENLGLLALRCLIIALLAVGFARPFLQHIATSAPPPPGAGTRTVLLVDTSASMRRTKVWESAREKVRELLRKAIPADEIAVLLFDRTARTLVSFDEWKMMTLDERAAVVEQRLGAISPAWAGTHLDEALIRAAELLEQPAGEAVLPREIVVISDMQEGTRLTGLQGYEWPHGLGVSLEPLSGTDTDNAGVQWVSEADDTGKPGEDLPLRVRVTVTPLSKREQFQLRWATDATPTGNESNALDVYVPAGQTRIVRPPHQPSNHAAPLLLTGDSADFDNALFVLPPQTARVPVLFLGVDSEDDPRSSLYYLRRAFPETRRQSIEIVVHRTDQPVPLFQLQQAQLLIVGDGATEAALNSARQFAREGRIVVAPLSSAGNAQNVSRLLGLPQIPASEASVKEYALFAQIDFQHPLFAPFADPRFSDFTKIHFWKYRRLDVSALVGAHVVARFDSGDPAIVQTPLGKGSVVVFTSSWRPSDSQFVLSSKFVPMLHALLEESTNLPAQKAQYFIGDEVLLPPGPQPFTVRKPDGTQVAAEAGSKFKGTDQRGIYNVAPGTLRFVVNLAPEESRTAPLPIERFTALGVPVRKIANVPVAHSPEHEARARGADLERRQKLWRWLIAAALGVVLLETLVARRLSRTSTISTAPQI